MQLKYYSGHLKLRRVRAIYRAETPGMRFIKICLSFIGKGCLPVVLISFSILVLTCLYTGFISPLFFAVALESLGLLILLIIYTKSRSDLAFAVHLFTFIFCFCIIVTCLIFIYYMQVFNVPYETGGTDDARFELQADALQDSQFKSYDDARELINLTGTGSWNPANNYVILVWIIRQIFVKTGLKPHTLNPRFFNGFLLAMTAVLVWWIARRCTKYEETARFAGYFAGLLPTVVFTASHIYRDVFIGFTLTLMIMLTVILMERSPSGRIAHSGLQTGIIIAALAVCLILSASMRSGLLVIAAGMVCLMILVHLKPSPKGFGLLVLIVVGVWIAASFNIFDEFLHHSAILIEYYTKYRAAGGSETGLGTGIYRLHPLLSYPLRAAYASISPLPIPSGYASENYRRLGVVIWFFSLPFLSSALAASLRKPKDSRDYTQRAIAVAFVCLYLSVALFTLQARQISMYIPAGAILIALGIEKSKASVLLYLFFMIILGLLLALSYVTIKFV